MNWNSSSIGHLNISFNEPEESSMWTAIRKEWDYLALAFLLGLYVTAAVAVVIILLPTLASIF